MAAPQPPSTFSFWILNTLDHIADRRGALKPSMGRDTSKLSAQSPTFFPREGLSRSPQPMLLPSGWEGVEEKGEVPPAVCLPLHSQPVPTGGRGMIYSN